MTELVLRIAFSLLVVLGLMWLLARLARRPLRRAAAGTGVSVLSRAQLSRSAAVAVVRVGGRCVLLGVTDQQVTLLGEAGPEPAGVPVPAVPGDDPQPAPPALDAPAGPLAGSALSPATWARTVDFLRDRTVRR